MENTKLFRILSGFQTLTLVRAGGMHPCVFLKAGRAAGRKFRITYGTSLAHFWVKADRVRSRAYDVMIGTASDRVFNGIVLSAG